ncbi:transposase [Flavobacterium gawalongense]|uniref:transposase n=1 Tax=Flavobacterium gawalongense TaxID=2594432 RepID=UPI001C3F6661|nr:transposase [Flavobacterium gawalongense]
MGYRYIGSKTRCYIYTNCNKIWFYSCSSCNSKLIQGDAKRKTSTGFEQTTRKYQARNCSNCPLNGVYHKSKSNRVIEINVNLKKLKHKAHELLNSEQGIERRKQRCRDVEPVFGNIKQNHRFQRFMLRSTKKVQIEWSLLAIAQNIRKKAAH